MKTEVSAGGVIVRRIKRGWEVLLLLDMNDSWTLPKGLVEKGEKKEDTAVREISEEVGLTKLQLLSPLDTIEYFYRKNGLIKKTVHYFLFELKGKQAPKPQISEGIRAVQWFSFAKAIEIVGYQKTNVKLLETSQDLLSEIAAPSADGSQ